MPFWLLADLNLDLMHDTTNAQPTHLKVCRILVIHINPRNEQQ